MPNHPSKQLIRQFLVGSFVLLSAYFTINGNWHKSRFPIQMDANGYYIFLPAIFIYHDIENLAFVDSMPEQFDRKYFLYPNTGGGYMTKYSPGLAILELPFFTVAHLSAKLLGLEASGYSPPYRLAMGIASIFYTCLGLWFMALVLLRYFNPTPVLITLALLLYGTNIFFTTLMQPATTHTHVFLVLALVLYFIDRWYYSLYASDFAWAAFFAGYAALIRPTEALVALVPVGYFFHHWKQQKFQFGFLLGQTKAIGLAIAGFGICLLPVMLYWKYATGNWVAYTYEQEGFYFDRPWQIWYGLFGFRKGWFIYTPLLFMAAYGFWKMRHDARFAAFRSAFWWYLPFNLFIVLSWYGWWYGGCFGNRALIPALALAAFPVAYLFNNQQTMKLPLLLLGGFFVLLNIFQTFQYQQKVMHMDAMTWRSYVYIFGKWKLSEDEKRHMETLLDHPDYSQRGKKLDEYFK
jgi:hypothetical protein